ncbi:MAG: AAA family ATPase [Bacteroidales bacterium]
MNFEKYFSPLTATPEQQEAFYALYDFLQNDSQIFILKGYAGTGKTTMIRALINYASTLHRELHLMAPTGRAAKILHDKTGYNATTIHRAIYSLQRLEIKNIQQEDIADRSIRYIFPIRGTNPEKEEAVNTDNLLLIIDEASMISSKKSEQEYFSFGSDIVLNDLLTFAHFHKGGKVIFIGDPAQLPPVGDNQSCAMSPEWMQEKGYTVESFSLTNVIRQGSDSTILLNATSIRNLLDQKQRSELIFKTKEGEVESVKSMDVAELYAQYFPAPSLQNSGVVISYSNKLAKLYNDKIREKLQPGKKDISEGDILMVVQNRYGGEIDLFNGDMLQVISVDSAPEPREIPVYITIDGKKERKKINLTFRDVRLQTNDGSIIPTKIIESLLCNEYPSLNPKEINALYIDFCIRNSKLKESTEEFWKALKADPYFNALRVKYGYAITCHKAQGGEWKKGFVDYSGRLGLNNDALRWCYTATTRFSERLFGIHLPTLSPMDKLKFSPIAKVNKPLAEAFIQETPEETPFHQPDSLACKKSKYHQVCEALFDTPYELDRVKSNPYMEEYYILIGGNTCRFDAIHDGNGYFKPFVSKSNSDEANRVANILNTPPPADYTINYQPSSSGLERLQQKMIAACIELDIAITNIVEHTENYYVNYYLKTSGSFSFIQFYFKANGILTQAMPKSDQGQEDEKLNLLIQKLA